MRFAILLVLGTAMMPLPASAQSVSPGKKGVGLAERRGMGEEQLKALRAAWYYNWGAESALKTGTAFVPMIFSLKHADQHVRGDAVLGYNEPDNAKQSNLSVKEALQHWARIAGKAKAVGSPAMAGNPLKSEWLHEFMKAKPKVDFLTVHWYKGAEAKHFIRDLEEIHARFGLPIWVTEFATQTAASSEKDPHKYSPAQVAAFIGETTRFMERTPWIQRYAWHDSRAGTSALFDESGGLTPTGRAYAAAGSGEH